MVQSLNADSGRSNLEFAIKYEITWTQMDLGKADVLDIQVFDFDANNPQMMDLFWITGTSRAFTNCTKNIPKLLHRFWMIGASRALPYCYQTLAGHRFPQSTMD